ncbi:bifunctional folylpolyglutamate synthase/dihydrofolate synthase [Luteolibacter ambystomatis]|uniref:Dihydrofolate synthase/folylpolyglutamate synthase n=1 Tax=Luteolibacter ambystomatis TaxID=2824561 RepID=A0A975G850_9BACT|nr:folylpolyglutamate synthase/dihydrofolate synthase family protein [Luteolibacter ambystomatis]QUE50718.1 bifunctional folylpolyglutamate synthase/dihydrofolate synthase [Luteolibacter ambystomatis]
MTYPEAIDWLFSTQMFGIKLGLEGPRNLLKEYLAFPKRGVKVIHVAGTNGKGSTCAMIDSVARAAGLRTGLFTSPHLVDYRERIQVSGQQIPEDGCAAMLTQLRGICEGLETHPTFFEITLALAMRWFSERECELIVLETGMGGRLDATTAVPADVCVVTPIGLDHTQWLGDTLELIAAEKAGIFIEGATAVSSPQEPAARFVLEKEANECRCPLTFVREPLLGYSIALAGPHQAWNAALALAALDAAAVPLSFDTVQYGLSHVKWPGRFERFPADCRPEIILDGAHNPHAAKVLAETWQQVFGDKKATLLFSAVSSKDISGILSLLTPLAGRILLCPVDTLRAVPTSELAAALPEGAMATEYATFDEALEASLAFNEPVLVAGSLFLVGEAKARLEGGEFQSSTQ